GGAVKLPRGSDRTGAATNTRRIKTAFPRTRTFPPCRRPNAARPFETETDERTLRRFQIFSVDEVGPYSDVDLEVAGVDRHGAVPELLRHVEALREPR